MLGELEGVDLKSISKELEQLNAQIAREREEIQATLSGNVSGRALGTFSHPGAAHRTSVPPQKHNRLIRPGVTEHIGERADGEPGAAEQAV
jgi:hypothetical protein